ncbi:MAG TPA: cupin domain-containing protein [Daejeonella sp.]|uniref:cupin domain-containing protein n=1 Tax=Daejeonella sp. TaxID=2805397 RepID=UPI002EDBA880
MKRLIFLMLPATLLYACNQSATNDSSKMEGNTKDTVASTQKVSDTLNIDIVQTSPNQARVLMENEHVRVVEYAVKPGEKDVWHTHPPRSSYVVSGGKVKVYSENGEPKISEVKTGASSWAGQGAKHYVENIGDTDIKIILTEIKSMH